MVSFLVQAPVSSSSKQPLPAGPRNPSPPGGVQGGQLLWRAVGRGRTIRPRASAPGHYPRTTRTRVRGDAVSTEAPLVLASFGKDLDDPQKGTR